MTRAKPSRPAEDLGGRIRDVIALGVAHLEKQARALTKRKSTAETRAELLDLVKEAATVMGHIRRYDEAQRTAAGALTPPIVIAYLRTLSPEKRLHILGEFGEEMDAGEEGSVLS